MTELEAKIVAAVQDATGLSAVDLETKLTDNADFDSLDLVAIGQMVEEKTGVYVTDEVLETAETVADLAAYVAEKKGKPSGI